MKFIATVAVMLLAAACGNNTPVTTETATIEEPRTVLPKNEEPLPQHITETAMTEEPRTVLPKNEEPLPQHITETATTEEPRTVLPKNEEPLPQHITETATTEEPRIFTPTSELEIPVRAIHNKEARILCQNENVVQSRESYLDPDGDGISDGEFECLSEAGNLYCYDGRSNQYAFVIFVDLPEERHSSLLAQICVSVYACLLPGCATVLGAEIQRLISKAGEQIMFYGTSEQQAEELKTVGPMGHGFGWNLDCGESTRVSDVVSDEELLASSSLTEEYMSSYWDMKDSLWGAVTSDLVELYRTLIPCEARQLKNRIALQCGTDNPPAVIAQCQDDLIQTLDGLGGTKWLEDTNIYETSFF